MSQVMVADVSLLSSHAAFLDEHVTETAREAISSKLPKLATNIGFVCIEGLLTPDAEALLEEISFAEPVTKEALLAHRVASPLINFMSGVSRLYVPDEELGRLRFGARRLSSVQRGDYYTYMEEHQDWEPGHAALYNRNVYGDQEYRIGGATVPIRSNQLVVINSRSARARHKGGWVLGTQMHEVRPTGGTRAMPTSPSGRDRYMVFHG